MLCASGISTVRASIAPRGMKQQGSMSLFAAVIVIPTLLLLLSMAFDLNSYFWQQQRLQRIADDAAIYGYRYLPRATEAVAAVEGFVAQQGVETAGQLSVAVDEQFNSLTVEYSAGIPLTFARAAAFLLGGDSLDDVALPVKVVAAARGTPFDVVIAMDASGYLAPAVQIPADLTQPCSFSSWGSAQDATAQSVFAAHPVICNNQVVAASYALERCFNPRFSAVKAAAVSLVDYFSRSKLNAVGAVVYPGIPAQVQDPGWGGGIPDAGATESLRSLQSALNITVPESATRFSRYSDTLGANESCQAALEAAYQFGGMAYRYPGESGLIPRDLAVAVSDPIQPSLHDWQVATSGNTFSLLEALWPQVARVSASPSVVDVLSTVRAQLFMGGVYGSTRGGMVGREAKAVFIVAGDLPHEGGHRWGDGSGVVESALESHLNVLRAQALDRQADLRLYYVIVEHAGYPIADLDAGLSSLRSLLLNAQEVVTSSDGQVQSQFDATAFRVRVQGADRSEIERVFSEVLGTLVLERKGGVLAY